MKPLVLIHPFPLSAEVFDADVAALAGRVRVLAPNMRGFGDAPRFDSSMPPSIDAMADDVARFLDRARIDERVIVGGISMGGYVSLAFARRHAERLAGLVLADTRAEPDDDAGRAGRDAAIARVAAGDLAGLVDGMLDKLCGEEARARVRRIAMRSAPAAVIHALRALRDRPDARPGLAAIGVPTLVLVGADDAITPPSAASALHAAIAGSELVVVPGARHLSNVDRPGAFHEALLAFAERVG